MLFPPVKGAFRAQVFRPCLLNKPTMALTTGSSSFMKQILMPNSLTFTHGKVYILKRKPMQSVYLIIHYISLFVPYEMSDRKVLCVYGKITASKPLRVAALEKARIKHLL